MLQLHKDEPLAEERCVRAAEAVRPVVSRRKNAEVGASVSYKGIGVACAFFGTLALVGAVANVCSGRFNFHVPGQAFRAVEGLVMGVVMFAVGMGLVKKSGRKEG